MEQAPFLGRKGTCSVYAMIWKGLCLLQRMRGVVEQHGHGAASEARLG